MSILLIDSYDSFTYNLKSLIEEASGLQVITIHNDTLTREQLKQYLSLFTAVIVGPGPGHPSNRKDVGIIPFLYEFDLPLLGICLGFQSLGLHHGSTVERLDSIRHGQVYKVDHNGDSLFDGIPQMFESVRYHSLHVTDLAPELQQLATTNDDGEEIVMGMKHREKPWYGVQYHPESICSKYGDQLIKNFVKIADKYNESKRNILTDPSLLAQLRSSIKITPLMTNIRNNFDLKVQKYQTDQSIIEICDSLNSSNQNFILLNSASYPGNWSIVGLPNEDSLYITHSTEEPSKVTLTKGSHIETQDIISIWEFVASIMEPYLSKSKDYEFPFIGGLMGLFSYEEGQFINLSTLPQFTKDPIPDTKLVFIEDCILRNNNTNETFIISNDSSTIKSLLSKDHQFIQPSQSIPTNFIIKPDEDHYKILFKKCQEYLASGDSYELCLTTNTKLSIPKSVKPWEIYKTLTSKNPSPYSAYFNFDDCILISSSPERFIHWDDNSCELRPIKGTVKNTDEMTREKAETILKTPKEVGENLMIVDLIRHDLFQLLNKVEVPKLMQVEEYSSVYHLVTAITGEFKNSEYTGIDILSRSLPPGSMTGAPKRRSVELLQSLENSRRGLYSGVCGYWSRDNKSDWSVIIRSIFHYKTDLENDSTGNIWRIGAGGAITVLSDCEGEWDELLTKLDSALQTFTL